MSFLIECDVVEDDRSSQGSIYGLALVVELGLGAIALAIGGFPSPESLLGGLRNAAVGVVAAGPPLLVVYIMSRSQRPASGRSFSFAD